MNQCFNSEKLRRTNIWFLVEKVGMQRSFERQKSRAWNASTNRTVIRPSSTDLINLIKNNENAYSTEEY